MKLALSLFTFVSLFVCTAAIQAPAQAPQRAATPTDAQAAATAVARAERPAYPLTTCVVGGEALTKSAIDEVVEGHLLRVCAAECAEKARKEPAKYRALVVTAVAKQQKPSYPLTTCAVTGDALGETAVDHVYGTRLVRLKDADTVAAFEKAPAPALSKVDQALIAAQLPTYRSSICPVMGDQLDRKAVNYLYGTRLVRLCCSGCIRKLNAEPEKYLAALDAANARVEPGAK